MQFGSRFAHLSQLVSVRALGVILCLLLVAGCDKSDKGTAKSSKDGAGSGDGQTTSSGKAKVYKLTPEQYAKEFDENQEAVHQKYGNFEIEITGIVEEVGMNVAGDSTVSLRAGARKEATANAPAEQPIVMCSTVDPEPWAKLARGQQATLRGVAGYLPLAPNMKECELVNSGLSTAIVSSAPELAGEYTGKIETFVKNNKDKNLVVTGKVLRTKADVAGAITLFLEGQGQSEVRCDFGMIESTIKKTVADVKVGQQVKVFGEVDSRARAADGLSLTACHLITK
jgi:hypothetical protein